MVVPVMEGLGSVLEVRVKEAMERVEAGLVVEALGTEVVDWVKLVTAKVEVGSGMPARLMKAAWLT